MADDSGAGAQRIIGAFEPFGGRAIQRSLLRSAVGNPFMGVDELPGTVALVLLGLAVLVAAAGLAMLLRRHRPARLEPRLVLVALLALAAPVGAALYSVVGDDIYIARNMTVSLPGLWLLAGAVIAALPRRAAIATGVLVLAVFAIGAAKTLDPDSQRPDYKHIAKFVDDDARPGDPVLELALVGASGPPGQALEVELQRRHPMYRVQVADGERRAVVQARGGRLYYVVPRVDFIEQAIAEGKPVIQGLDPSFRLTGRRDYPGLVPMTVYVYSDERAAGR
jgi:hypothetical protein